MSDLRAASEYPSLADQPRTTELQPPPGQTEADGTHAPRRGGARWTTLLAVFLVVAIGGGALFVCGFSLRRAAGATPPPRGEKQDLFPPFLDGSQDKNQNIDGTAAPPLL